MSNSRKVVIGSSDSTWLPTTFNISNVRELHPVAERLLINTGCWIADLRGDWKYKICWRFVTDLWWKDGEPTCHVDSEDWEFSRDLFAMGYGERVFATSRIAGAA